VSDSNPRNADHQSHLLSFDRLARLEYDWDGDGAEIPAAQVIERARATILLAEQNSLTIGDIDPDVLGGVAILLRSTDGSREVWVAIMNNGHDSAIASTNHAPAWRERWTDETMDHVVLFLNAPNERSDAWRQALHEAGETWFRGYAERSDVTVEWLRENGQDVAPCDCDEPECMGWQCVDVAAHARWLAAMRPKKDCA
jgi:hypothetical protein